MVYAEVVTLGQLYICRYDVAQAQAEDIPGNQSSGVNFLPFPVSFDPGFKGQLLLQGFNRVGRLIFLPKTHDRVKDQKHEDNNQIHPVFDQGG